MKVGVGKDVEPHDATFHFHVFEILMTTSPLSLNTTEEEGDKSYYVTTN